MISGGIRVKENIRQDLKRESRQISKAQSDAIISAGYNLRQSIKRGMLKEAPGGEKWPPLHPWSRYRLIAKGKRTFSRRKQAGKRTTRKIRRINIGGKPQTALKRLAAAVRYRKFVDRGSEGNIENTRVKVGFLSRRAAELAEYHASGPHLVPVSPKMRRMMFAMGLVLTRSQISIPRRRHVEVVYERNKGKIADFIRRRVEARVGGMNPRGITPDFG